MKVSNKIKTRMELETIREEEQLRKEQEEREAKRLSDLKKIKPIMEKKQIAYDAIAKAEAEDKLRDEISPAECLKIVKECVEQFSTLPRMKVIELLKTDEELSEEVGELKRQAQVIFKHVPKDNQIRMAVVSLFKISLDIDLELIYVEDKRKNKKVEFDENVEEIDPERKALLEKLKSKKK